MTDEQPAEIRRPPSARPRGARAAVSDDDQPTDDECRAIEGGLVDLARHSGATIHEDRDLGVVLSILRGRGPGYNFAGCPRWADDDVSERLARLESLMRAEREWPALVVAEGVSQPADLPTTLAAAGWVEVERERILWLHRPPGVPHLDPSLRIEAITPRSAAAYEQVERAIFGLADDFAAQRTAGLSYSITGGWLRAYLVRFDGEPVATARLALGGDGVACIFGVGVVEHFRRRGLGTLVTAVATRAGLASGNRIVWLSVSELNDAALSVYARLGFQRAYAWSRWVASAV